MRSTAGTVRFMLVIALALLTQAAVTLWRALPEIVDSGRAAYHTLAGICRHPFHADQTEVITGAAVLVLAGVAVVLGRLLWHALQQWRCTRSRLRLVLAARVAGWPAAVRAAALPLGLSGHLDVVDHPAPFAFCYGFLRPRICISSGLARLLTPTELAAVLVHEDCHRRRRDPLLVLLADALAHALFFIPALHDLRARYDAGKEFDADAAAIRRLGGVEPMAAALYKVLSCPVAGPDLSAAAVGGLSVTERRIDHLVAPRADNLPGFSRRRLALSGLAVSAVSAPLLLLTIANVQPLLHACRI